MAMLFLARCVDTYLEDDGKFGFLLPYTVFKTQAGAGFRLYLKSKSHVLRLHDLVELYPFEGATNRTSAIVLQKGETQFPISGLSWQNPEKRSVLQESELRTVKKLTRQFDMAVAPVQKDDVKTPWMMIGERALAATDRLRGSTPYYRAFRGLEDNLHAVFWVDIVSEKPGQLLIKNSSVALARRDTKDYISKVRPELVYPLIRGRNVKRWFGRPRGHILLPVTGTGQMIPHRELRVKYPGAYDYFHEFFEELVNRSAEPYKTRLRAYQKMAFDRAEKTGPPFYWVFNAKPQLAPYKVVWKRLAGAITGKAISFAASVIEPAQIMDILKPVIPDKTLVSVPTDTLDEAYYLSGILNSSPAVLLIASYTYELGMETNILQYLKIPKFDPGNLRHMGLVKFSRSAHQLASQAAEEELGQVEDEIDRLVAQLYGLFDEELQEVRRSLALLKGEEAEEEMEEIELPVATEPDILLRNNVVEEGKPFKVEVVISNPTEEPLKNVTVKLSLFDKRTIEKEFDKVEDSVSFRLDFPSLAKGRYKVKASVSLEAKGGPRKLGRDLTIYVKGGKEPKHIERAVKLEDLFKE